MSFNNLEFENAFKLAVLTLMNTVNSSAYGIAEFSFQNLHFLTKYFLILFMIIGRVELLTLLLITKKFIFKNWLNIIYVTLSFYCALSSAG